MGIILILLLLLLPLLLYVLIRKNGSTRFPPGPPGPPGLPLIRNLHQLDNLFLQDQLWKMSQKYGPIMSLKLGSIPTVVVSSGKMAKAILKTHDIIFCTRPSLLGQEKISYNGKDVALAAYSPYWRDMKKTVTLHLSTVKRVKSFRPIREDEVSRMIMKVSELADSSKLVNLSEIIMSLTSTIICRVAFSKRFDAGDEQGNKLRSLLYECQDVLTSFYIGDYFPLLGWVDTLSGLRARLDKNFKEMDLFYQQLIDEHLDPASKQLDPEREDIIDIFLQLKNDESSSIDFTLNNIKAVIMNILLGGTDTSAATVVWTMTSLMKNPEILEKAQTEVRNVVGKKGRVDEDDLQQLPYLRMAIKEAMRLHPPIPLLLPREAMESCVIDGYNIKAKTMVYVNAYAIGRDPECWVDPEKFIPERFISHSTDYKGQGQNFGWIPFGAGRRVCAGIGMGSTTVELILSNLLYSFDWELPAGMNKEDIDIMPMPGVTVHKKIPLCLFAKPN